MSRWRPTPSFSAILFTVPWVVAAVVARSPIRDNSFLWHVRAGTLQIDAGRVLVADPFSFTFIGRAWRTQSWLMDLLYGQLERWHGLGFVWVMVLVAGVLIVVAVALIAGRDASSSFGVAAFVVVTSLVLASYLNPRPAIASYLFLALAILANRDSRLRWSLPLVIWVWASVHGSWFLAVFYLVLDALLERRRRAVITIGPAIFVGLATAHGWAMVEIVWGFVRNRDALSLITEWAPTNFASAGTLPLLIGVAMLALPARRGLIPPASYWIIVPFLYLGASSTRSVPLAWLALTPWLALIVKDWRPLRFSGSSESRRALNATLILATLTLPFFITRAPQLDDEHFPVAAAAALSPGPAFHDDTTGGYLIYASYPQRLVMIDDRAELYGDFIGRFISVRNAQEDWGAFFQAHGLEQALLRRRDPLASVLRLAGWRVVFEDETFLVLHDPA